MYDELYAAWRLEVEDNELGSLPADFYARIANYMQNLKEETKSQQEQDPRAVLVGQEQKNAVRMTKELVTVRYRKLLKLISSKRKIPQDHLTTEEQRLHAGILPAISAFDQFSENLLEGHLTQINVEPSAPAAAPPVEHKRVMVRFLKPVPSIMGSDMKSYGPFLVEDVSSVPVENAKILVKQGLARLVEPS